METELTSVLTSTARQRDSITDCLLYTVTTHGPVVVIVIIIVVSHSVITARLSDHDWRVSGCSGPSRGGPVPAGEFTTK